MSILSRKAFVILFAEEIVKCVLTYNNIPWDPRWGFGGGYEDLLSDFNNYRTLVAESVSRAAIRFRPIVMEEGSYVWDGMINSSDIRLLLPSLIAVGDKLGKRNDSFFIFMAIVNDLCKRFYRHDQLHFIVYILKAVESVMRIMAIYTPKSLRRKALAFLEEMNESDT